jgi:hypothetical protein
MRIKGFKKFNEGIEYIYFHINSAIKKGSDFADGVWEVIKRESQETKIAADIVSRMISGDDVSDKEKEFVKKQSGDLSRILPLIAIQGIPIPIPITPLLIVLGKKYGYDFLPKDHRDILNTKIKLTSELSDLLNEIPETGMGYHIVDVLLKNGRVLNDKTILNGDILVLGGHETITVEDIEDIFIS